MSRPKKDIAGSVRQPTSDFAKRFYEAALYNGLKTQSEMADSLKIARQTINRWWVLGANPTAEMIYHIAEKWRVSSEWLGRGVGAMVVNGSESKPDDLRERLAKIYLSMDRYERDLWVSTGEHWGKLRPRKKAA